MGQGEKNCNVVFIEMFKNCKQQKMDFFRLPFTSGGL
jgi:hypothetical protein